MISDVTKQETPAPVSARPTTDNTPIISDGTIHSESVDDATPVQVSPEAIHMEIQPSEGGSDEDEKEEVEEEEVGDDNTDGQEHLTDIKKKSMSSEVPLETSDSGSECLVTELQKFKADLLRFHCVRFGKVDCDKTQIPSKFNHISLVYNNMMPIYPPVFEKNDNSVKIARNWSTKIGTCLCKV